MRNNAFHSTYLAERMGSVTLTPGGDVEAGSLASFTLTYTAGYFGIDDYRQPEDRAFASPATRGGCNSPIRKGWNYVDRRGEQRRR
jgi:hypothetical protein